MHLFHGSKNIIKKPIIGVGNIHNDYGLGFYLTENIELAKEWASTDSENAGFVNEYVLDLKNLKVLNINKEYNILTWTSILANFKDYDIRNPITEEIRKKFVKKYYVDVDKYDVLIGYRADDCYYSFTKSFLRNEIPVEVLEKVMKLGNLGEQIVLKSKKAFNVIKFVKAEEVNVKEYFAKRALRAKKAAENYYDIIDRLKPSNNTINNILERGY